MEEETIKTIEYSVEALLIAWFGYLFFYQNYILYEWHRGRPLPSRVPFVLLGVLFGALFLWYEFQKMEREFAAGKRKNASPSEEAEGSKPSQEQESPKEE